LFLCHVFSPFSFIGIAYGKKSYKIVLKSFKNLILNDFYFDFWQISREAIP